MRCALGTSFGKQGRTRSHLFAAATVCAFGAFTVVSSHADGSPPRLCQNGESASLAELACELGHSLGPQGDGVAIAFAVPASDRPLTRATELVARFAQFAVKALGAARVIDAATLAEARTLARSDRVLVFISMDLEHGEVHAVADTYAPQGFWDRIRNPTPLPGDHARASRRIDGEIASFLPAVPLAFERVERATLSTTDVVALSCGDVLGDGALELVVVGRRKISVFEVRGGKFDPSREASWTTLSAVAPSPLREPIATVSVVPGRGVDVGLTDRKVGFQLSPALAPVESFDGKLPLFGVGCFERSGIALGVPSACLAGDATLGAKETALVDAVATGVSVDAIGRARHVAAFRGAGDHAVVLKDDAGHVARVEGVGAALAVADLDLDGNPELVSTVDTLVPTEDAVVIRSWGADGVVRERLRIPAPEGVHALAACPSENGAPGNVVVATSSGLSILR